MLAAHSVIVKTYWATFQSDLLWSYSADSALKCGAIAKKYMWPQHSGTINLEQFEAGKYVQSAVECQRVLNVLWAVVHSGKEGTLSTPILKRSQHCLSWYT